MPSSFRTFNSPGGPVVNGVAYLYDTDSGVFRPAYKTDFASNVSMNVSGLNLTVGSVAVTGGVIEVNNTSPIPTSGVATILSLPTQNVAVTGGAVSASITNTAPIAISGVVQGNFDSAAIVSAQATGNGLNVTSNTLLSGISGLLDGSLNDPAYVTGAVSITNTAPLAISGIVHTVVTGSVSSNTDLTPVVAAQATGNTFLSAISGLLSTSVATPAWVTGTLTNPETVISNTVLSGISGILATNLAGAAWVTGNVSDSVGNQFLSGISGLLSSNLTDPAWVTGSVSLANTAPIAISGIVQTIVTGSVSSSITNPIGITGTRYDQALPVIGSAPNFVMIGGRVVSASGAGSITGYNSTGDFAVLNVSRENGGVLVNQGALDYTQDSVTSILSGQALTNSMVANQLLSGISGVLATSVPGASWVTGQVTASASSAASVSNEFVSGSAQLVLPSTTTRKGWFIQNLATGSLMVRLSSSAPTTGALNFILRGGTSNNDGQGGSFSDSPAVYTGPVYVSGLNEAPMLYTAWQI